MILCLSEKDVYLSNMVKKQLIDEGFRVGVVLLDGFALMSYAALVEPLRAANRIAGRSLYHVRHMPAAGARAISSSGAIVAADTFLGEHVDFDLVLVVAGSDFDSGTSKRLEHWLRLLVSRRIMVGGVSAGPLILARAGVMDGYRMTVHWDHVEQLRHVSANLVIESSLYVRDRGRLTCAGGAAAMDMMLSLIAEHHQAQFAQQVSDWFIQSEVRAGDDAQRYESAARYGVDNVLVIKALQAMESHFDDPLTLIQISDVAGVSSRQINRLFQQHLGTSTSAHYHQLRLNKARSLLHNSLLSISDVAMATGFGSLAHFSKQYRRAFSKSPSQCRSEHKANSVSS